MIDGEEDCRSLEELAGTPTGRSMGIGMMSYKNLLKNFLIHFFKI